MTIKYLFVVKIVNNGLEIKNKVIIALNASLSLIFW